MAPPSKYRVTHSQVSHRSTTRHPTPAIHQHQNSQRKHLARMIEAVSKHHETPIRSRHRTLCACGAVRRREGGEAGRGCAVHCTAFRGRRALKHCVHACVRAPLCHGEQCRAPHAWCDLLHATSTPHVQQMWMCRQRDHSRTHASNSEVHWGGRGAARCGWVLWRVGNTLS